MSALPLAVISQAPEAGEATPAAQRRPPLAPVASRLDRFAEVYEALVLGTRDYVRKNGFSEVLVGLSGGVDSSLVATIAADALGPGGVHGVLMPSRFSSAGSVGQRRRLSPIWESARRLSRSRQPTACRWKCSRPCSATVTLPGGWRVRTSRHVSGGSY